MITSRRPRILYDASLAGNPAGTGTFVRGLLAGLRATPEIEVITTTFDSVSTANVDTARKTPVSRLASSVRHLQYYVQTLPRRARELDCDLVLCPSSLVPLSGSVPFLMTVFDLTPLRFSSTQDWFSRQYLAGMIRAGVRRASGICTISQAVAAEITSRFTTVPSGRVHVTYPGPNPELLQAIEEAPAIPDRPFALMVGTVEPRKNHLTVMRAFAEHRRRQPDSSLMLVTAGSAGWHYRPVLQAIDELQLAGHVIRLGTIGPDVLKWLYQHSRALLFPSLYEGFGLPVLEALSLGCPVVAARLPSVMEITGETAQLLEPTDVPAWASALDGLEQARRDDQLVEAYRRRANRFTWEACTAAAVAAIRAALGRPP
jgi:glycosyltransferase involved in cell wall biosynthesis